MACHFIDTGTPYTNYVSRNKKGGRSLYRAVHTNTKYCPSQPRAMGCGLIRGLTPVATHAHADAPDYRSRSHLRGPVSTKPSQRSRALTPLNTPPATGSFNSPWPSMSGAGKRNRACERATPYPPPRDRRVYRIWYSVNVLDRGPNSVRESGLSSVSCRWRATAAWLF